MNETKEALITEWLNKFIKHRKECHLVNGTKEQIKTGFKLIFEFGKYTKKIRRKIKELS